VVFERKARKFKNTNTAEYDDEGRIIMNGAL
jgi:hypothetical protein